MNFKSHTFMLVLFFFILFHSSVTVNAFQDTQIKKEFPSLLSDVIKEVQNSHHKEQRLLGLLESLLDHGNRTNQSALYAQSCIKLFSNVVKGTHYINAHTFCTFLEQINKHMAPYFSHTLSREYLRTNAQDMHMYDRFKATVNSMLYVKFSSEYDSFKSEPELFLNTIALHILDIMQEEVQIEKLRNTLVRFLELAIGKLVWSPDDQEKTWHSVKDISLSLAALFENSILDDVNDLDDLFWSLIHRYSFFLELTGSMLQESFYTHVKHALRDENLLILTLQEQDDFVESKAHYLQRVLFQAEVKSRAYQKGILM